MIDDNLILIFLIIWFYTENIITVNFIKGLQFRYKNHPVRYILQHALCLKCLTFWIFLFTTFDILTALSFSFIGAVYEKIR